MRALALATLVLSGPTLAEPPAEYVPAPASEIPGYSETVFPCEEVLGWKTKGDNVLTQDDVMHQSFDRKGMKPQKYVDCAGEPYLKSKSLRELALLRNTIYARYGWGGFRKTWLREHFQKQPWYKPEPKFSFKRLSKVDRQNVELIAKAELSFRYTDLERARDTLLAAADKWWGDLASYEGKRGEVYACALEDYKGPTEHLDTDIPLPWVQRFEEAVAASKDAPTTARFALR